MSVGCLPLHIDSNRKCKFKIVLLGEQNVGKSSIITRFVYDRFEVAYDATIGIDFVARTFYYEGIKTRLQIWDTAGQEKYASLIPSYIRDCSIAIVVYDITDLRSFTLATKWVEKIRVERDDNAVIMLVGNKTDLELKRKVSMEDGEKKADDLNVLFIEASAKEGYNVKMLFKRLIANMPGWEAFDCIGEKIELEEVKLRVNDELTTKSQSYAAESKCAC